MRCLLGAKFVGVHYNSEEQCGHSQGCQGKKNKAKISHLRLSFTDVPNNLLGVVQCSKQHEELTPATGIIIVSHDPRLVLRAAILI